VSVQAITLQFEFILAVKRSSNLYAPLLGSPLRHCQLSSQQLKEKSCNEHKCAGGKGKVHAAHNRVPVSLAGGGYFKWHYSKLSARQDSLHRHCTLPPIDFSFLSFIPQ